MVLITHWHILMTMLFCHNVKASENISVNKTSSQSTSWDGYPSSLAIDGNKDCKIKFTYTNENEQSAWWQVNLGDVYEIKKINIYYRTTGYTHRLNGYSIEIALNDPSYQDAWLCYKDVDISQLPSSTPSHICRSLGQYIKLYVERLQGLTYSDYDGKGAVINLCEFEVFGCLRGRYGNENCASTCSAGCLDSRCDPDNGYCNCTAGWKGDKCDTRISFGNGYYDDSCLPCPNRCIGYFNKLNGHCGGRCKDSFYGALCEKSCPVNCKNTRCHQSTGYCMEGCESLHYIGNKCNDCNIGRYLLGDICIPCSDKCLNKRCDNETSECLDGCNPSFYGKFCNLTCSTNCSISCARYSGQCIGCKVGFYGDKCDKICEWNCKDNVCKQDDGYCSWCHHPYKGSKCTECVDGYFGDTCTPCPRGCGNELCRKDDGYCTEGCKNGFYGNFCTQPCPINCKQNKCDSQTGDCSDGCRTGNFLGNRCNGCVNWLYGKDCDIACPVNCKHNMCVGKDGICMLGCKYANMTGNHCDGYRTTTEGLAFKINSYIASIIAGVVSLINIIFITVILGLFCKRRRRKEALYENQKSLDWTQEGMNQQDNNQLEQQQTVHYETLDLHDRGSVNTSPAQAYTGLNVNTEGRY